MIYHIVHVQLTGSNVKPKKKIPTNVVEKNEIKIKTSLLGVFVVVAKLHSNCIRSQHKHL